MQLNYYRENPERITAVTKYTLRFAGWDASKARIVQLLNDATQLADIAKYYENLHELDNFRRSSITSAEWRWERVGLPLPSLLDHSNLARKHIMSRVQDSVSRRTHLESLQRNHDDRT